MLETKIKTNNEKFCAECGSLINLKAEICPKCGVRQAIIDAAPTGILNHRKCLSCGHSGVMKTWLRNYNLPQFVAVVGLFFWILPGLAFIGWAWGKYKCPKCGKVAENTQS